VPRERCHSFPEGWHGIGKLAAMVSPSDSRLTGACQIEFSPAPGDGEKQAGRSYHYTEFGDVDEVTDCADGSTFPTKYGYDKFGRPNLLRCGGLVPVSY
jgi:hypothetical protein